MTDDLTVVYTYTTEKLWSARVIDSRGLTVNEQAGFQSLVDAIEWGEVAGPIRDHDLTITYCDGLRTTLWFTLSEAFYYMEKVRHYPNITAFSLRRIRHNPSLV